MCALICVCMCALVCVPVCMRVLSCVPVYVCALACVCICAYVCVCMYVGVCMCTCAAKAGIWTLRIFILCPKLVVASEPRRAEGAAPGPEGTTHPEAAHPAAHGSGPHGHPHGTSVSTRDRLRLPARCAPRGHVLRVSWGHDLPLQALAGSEMVLGAYSWPHRPMALAPLVLMVTQRL